MSAQPDVLPNAVAIQAAAVRSGRFEYHIEVIDGIAVEKPMPGYPHQKIERFLQRFFDRELPPGLSAYHELDWL